MERMPGKKGDLIQEARLLDTEAILDALPHPTFAIDHLFQIRRLNRAALELTGKSEFSHLMGETCYSEFHNRDTVCPFCPLVDVPSTESGAIQGSGRIDHSQANRTISKIIQEKHKGGPEKTLQLHFFFTGHQYISHVEMIEDITGEKEHQEETLRKENLTAMGTMISGIAHELNNPLTGMGLTLQNLMANLDTMESPEIKSRLNILYKDLRRASRIVTDILSFSRPGNLKLTRSDIRLIVQRAKNTIQRLYPVLCRKTEWIFEGDDSIIFDFHPEKVERLFFNLFRNTIQALDYKSGYIRVEFRQSRKNVHVIVEDNAGGIPEEQLNRVFQPFYSNSKGSSGSGLGLSICHSIVKEHSGRIRVRSSSGKTTFHISLPWAGGLRTK